MAGSLAVLVGLLAVDAGFAPGRRDRRAAWSPRSSCAAAARLIAENANVLMDRTPGRGARRPPSARSPRSARDIELSRLRLRESAGRYFADVVVTVPPGQAVVEGHQAADLIEAGGRARAARQRRGRARRAAPPRPRPARPGARDRAGRAARARRRTTSRSSSRTARVERLAAPEVPRRPRPARRRTRSPSASSGRSASAPGWPTCRPTSSRSSARSRARAADVQRRRCTRTREIERLVRERTGSEPAAGAAALDRRRARRCS